MLLVTVAAFGMLSVAARWANGSCVAPVIADQIQQADVVASGVVTAVGFAENRVTFRASILYKGTLAARAVTVRTGPIKPSGPGAVFTSVSSSNDYRPYPGTHHTLYLHREADELVTDSCSGSHHGPATDLEIAALGSGRVIDSGAGPLTQFADQLATLAPLLTYALVPLAVITFVLWLRWRRGPGTTHRSGTPAT